MRGLQHLQKCLNNRAWIIPARAGFTRNDHCRYREAADHPRACGVYSFSSRISFSALGSSPRVRGLLSAHTERTRTDRIIPARAGFTVGLPVITPVVEDHPRACGVYGNVLTGLATGGGSSPRVRGLLLGARVRGLSSGIIPARAGFTREYGQ